MKYIKTRIEDFPTMSGDDIDISFFIFEHDGEKYSLDEEALCWLYEIANARKSVRFFAGGTTVEGKPVYPSTYNGDENKKYFLFEIPSKVCLKFLDYCE